MKKTEKIRYEIDPHNRLIYERTGKDSGVSGFRTVLEGTFEICKDGSVIYHVKKSQGIETPQQIKLRGKWSLDSEHNLVLTLDKWGNQIYGNRLTIGSELIDASSNALAFSLTSRDSAGGSHVYIVNLNGKWQADERNRLIFEVEKESGKADRITLQGGWVVNNQNQILYTYERYAQGRKKKITQAVTFKGYWDINEKNRIIYILNKELNSGFEFRVSAGRPSKRGLEYEIGVGVNQDKKTITLFGNWKVSENLGLLFEMPSENGRINRLIFGATATLDKNLNLQARLENKLGKDVGIDLKISRTILKEQGEVFIRALKSQKEVSIVAGLGFRW